MDELSPEAEAKDMELVATRGEEEQGSGRSFRRPWVETKQSGLCDDEVSPEGEFLSAPPERNQKPVLLPEGSGKSCGLSGPAPTGGILSLAPEKVPKERA